MMANRLYLGGILEVSEQSVIPCSADMKEEYISTFPTLHANGLRDDTEALSNFLIGEPIVANDEIIKISDGTFSKLYNARFLIRRPLIVSWPGIKIENCEFRASAEYPEDADLFKIRTHDFILVRSYLDTWFKEKSTAPSNERV